MFHRFRWLKHRRTRIGGRAFFPKIPSAANSPKPIRKRDEKLQIVAESSRSLLLFVRNLDRGPRARQFFNTLFVQRPWKPSKCEKLRGEANELYVCYSFFSFFGSSATSVLLPSSLPQFFYYLSVYETRKKEKWELHPSVFFPLACNTRLFTTWRRVYDWLSVRLRKAGADCSGQLFALSLCSSSLLLAV